MQQCVKYETTCGALGETRYAFFEKWDKRG